MRKLLLCVPMIMLLSACGHAPGGVGPAEELALTIRGEYAALSTWTAQAEITADYGQRVYEYAVAAEFDGVQTRLTLTAPDTVAGLTAVLTEDSEALEFDGLWVETGPLDPEGLTPAAALPALVETARTGYITACRLEEDGLLRVDCGDPEADPGTGTETALWFQPDSHQLLRGEISREGFRTVRCDFSDFSKT